MNREDTMLHNQLNLATVELYQCFSEPILSKINVNFYIWTFMP